MSLKIKSPLKALKTALQAEAKTTAPITTAPITTNPSMPVHPHAFDKEIIKWEAPEYIKHPKSKLWFILAGLVVLSFVIWGIWTNSWSTALVFLLLAGVYLMHHAQEPLRMTIIVSEMGIKYSKDFIPYNLIDHFWIVYDPGHVATLNLKVKRRFLHEITIQLGDQDPNLVRSYLALQIPEGQDKDETFTHLLVRLFRL